MIPYFVGASRVGKAELVVDWILAFARMTAGGVLRAVGFFTGGDAPPSRHAQSSSSIRGNESFLKKVLVGHFMLAKNKNLF